MTSVPDPAANAAEVILAYHQRTKHRLERYAAGPETLDWSAQPNPFREFEGAPRVLLPLDADRLATSFSDVYDNRNVPPAPLDLSSVGALLQLSMALAAWKEYGPDRWALRCTPSSGNLHPTETYVVSRGISGLSDGIHHYVSRDHSLERRCGLTGSGQPGLWIGLSSIHWREAWKYGERAFRYCHLDVGHALGALRYAAGTLGWTARMAEAPSSRDLALLFGLDRDKDFPGAAERESPDLLLRIIAETVPTSLAETSPAFAAEGLEGWTGRANVLDPRKMYKWPVIDEASAATRKTNNAAEPRYRGNFPPIGVGSSERATSVILNRRSAQGFDRRARMGSGAFYHLIDRLLARSVAPWDVWTYAPRLHPVFFIHRVDGLEPGLYILLRNPEAELRLKQATRKDFLWQRPDHVPPQLDFYRLVATDCTKVARTLHCHQAIAADSCFALGMIAEFEPLVRAEPWRYKQLHWEAGLLGHVLYLEAETLGFRGTGIGCYFDDSMHEIMGFEDATFASLYHFTVGLAPVDTRITTLPPYGQREAAAEPDIIELKPDKSLKGAGAMAEEATFERVGIAFARDLMQSGEALVLDMRDSGSYESGHIEGAEHVTEANIFNFLSGTPKTTPVLIYCYHGNGSQVYAKTFADFHFTKVYSLDGGYEEWKKAGA
jgi:rhodanese-related sulfurtransferase/nitroreductase